MKLLKTIHFDPSDNNVYEDTAGSDEWAISGAFAFSNTSPENLAGKEKQAFSNGFLSLENFGRATFTSVCEVTEEQYEDLANILANRFIEVYGAPSLKDALPVAFNELSFIKELCESHPINTIFTVKRFFDDDGEIREEYRTVKPPSKPLHTRIWDIIDDDDE